MRLNKIKLAGFKSFVDATTINFPSNLVGIVGPNGCGKSNTIDAVRWVMGESSAKHLRGDTMDDVIFNGSSVRKPVAQASVELVFDNKDNSLGGEYAEYNEISVKRQVSRDGQSTYFLNGTKCRRKDITDIFLGTGLGPRSYAIIEQGMISRFVEAKPQELRNYIEEAAGISKYKERRRETENRIRHTRDNLERLGDIREELGKQLSHLQRQAQTAEKYKELKNSERLLKAELLVLRLNNLDDEVTTREEKLASKTTELEKIRAAVRETEAAIESSRQDRIDASESFEDIQSRFYKIGNEITELEQQIIHEKNMLDRQEREKQDNIRALDNSTQKIAEEEERLQTLIANISQTEPEYEQLDAQYQEKKASQEESRQQLHDSQRQWEDYLQEVASPTQEAQVERAKMDQFERHIANLNLRETKLKENLSRLQFSNQDQTLQTASNQVADAQQELAISENSLNEILTTIESQREKHKQAQNDLVDKQRQTQQSKGRLASLEALQQASLGKDKANRKREDWYNNNSLANAKRLGELIKAPKKWEAAVEIVLNNSIESVVVDNISAYAGSLDDALDTGAQLIESTSLENDISSNLGSLWSTVTAPESIKATLDAIKIADNVDDAIKVRSSLKANESVITPDGVWFGPNWLKLCGSKDQHAGVLSRTQEINELRTLLEELEAQIASQQEIVEQLATDLASSETQRQEKQLSVNEGHRQVSKYQSELSSKESNIAQQQKQRDNLSSELADIAEQLSGDYEALEQATTKRNLAVTLMDELSYKRIELEQSREQSTQLVNSVNADVAEFGERRHQMNARLQGYKAQEDACKRNIESMTQQIQHLQDKNTQLLERLAGGEKPVNELQAKLEHSLSLRVAQEETLIKARESLQAIEHKLVEFESQKSKAEQSLMSQQESVSKLKLDQQEFVIRKRTIEEQFQETDFSVEDIRRDLDESATVTVWESSLQSVTQRIQRLGAINLAAVDEFKEKSERKEYLDKQDEDLLEALETLEKAISKIDKETRNRFKETFDKVNSSLKTIFPKLFGGGQAHLEMTEDNLLSTGLTIMARPPGKRISNIHLMSGGEKALTAVAMVFSIFELNPAPFCMLDEVDAPLDEANVGRFCNMVNEMSEHVQFIFITHNKRTMELSNQLMGVTMREPGVSRLVDVDVSEASKIVAAGQS